MTDAQSAPPWGNVVDVFVEAAREWPDRAAIRTAQASITFGQLDRESASLAEVYAARDVRLGDRVLVVVPMGVGLYRVVLALLRLGAVPVFLDQWSSLGRLRASARVADGTALVAGRALRWVSYVFPELRGLRRLSPTSVASAGPSSERGVAAVAPHDAALVTFTTGSTGVPKAAVRTHAVLRAQLDALRPLLEPARARTEATLLPIVVLLNLAIGRTTYLPSVDYRRPARFDAGRFCRELQSAGVTSLTGSPYYLIAAARHLRTAGVRLPLERVLLGGAPVWPNEAADLLEGFGSARVTVVYGSTEAEPIAHVEAAALATAATDRGLPVGTVDPTARVRIEPPGGVGEVWVAGPHVVDRYLNNEEAFRQNKVIDAQGTLWHRTGDLACLSATGRLSLYGRLRERLDGPAGPAYPFLLERSLSAVEGVTRGAVVALRAEVVVAYEGDGVPEGALRTWSRRELPGRQVSVVRLRALPLDPRHHGKVDYDALRDLCGRRRLDTLVP